jgi:hypothetical protein
MSKFTLSIETLARRSRAIFACAVAVCSLPACSDSEDDPDSATEANQPANAMSFFVTSTTQDGNLGGLMGADGICNRLARAAGSSKTFAAYLSAENSGSPIHARSRIGDGPWYNANGDLLAQNLTDLFAPTLVGDPDLFITETGEKVNGQWNSSNGMNGTPRNEHDIMTASDANGMLLMTNVTTCADWTSNSVTPGPQVGHSDGMGPMMNTAEVRFTSWGGGHASQGCSSDLLAMSGGAGRFYCFATD